MPSKCILVTIGANSEGTGLELHTHVYKTIVLDPESEPPVASQSKSQREVVNPKLQVRKYNQFTGKVSASPATWL